MISDPSDAQLIGLDLAGRELVELDILKVTIKLALGLELPGLAGRLDPAVVENDDLLARPDCREPVGQDDQGAAFREPLDGVVDQVLDIVIEWDVRLFDDQDRGVVQVGASQGDPILLVGLEDSG